MERNKPVYLVTHFENGYLVPYVSKTFNSETAAVENAKQQLGSYLRNGTLSMINSFTIYKAIKHVKLDIPEIPLVVQEIAVEEPANVGTASTDKGTSRRKRQASA